MDIYNILQFGNTQYNQILDEFLKFKQFVLKFLTNFEEKVQQIISIHMEFTSISNQHYEFIEKEFGILEFLNSIKKRYTIKNNLLQYKGQDYDITLIGNQLKSTWNSIQIYLQQQFMNSNYNIKEKIILNDLPRHQDIEIINDNEIRRSKLSNGRWLIQTIQQNRNNNIQLDILNFTVNGSDIIFGIASLSKIVEHNFEFQCDIPSAYFIRQDGVHYGFGLTETQQDFDVPEFSSRKGHIISMKLDKEQNLLILKNLITQAKQEYEIPQISEDWCYIVGLRYQNDFIRIEE